MNPHLLAPAASAFLLALTSAGSTAYLLRPPPSLPDSRPFEQHTWYLEGDLGRDRPDRALTLTPSAATLARARDAYRAAPGPGLPPDASLTPIHYGKVFGDTPVTDTYYLLARLTTRTRTPSGGDLHLWRRTGPSPWRYLGVHRDPADVPSPLRNAWTSYGRSTVARGTVAGAKGLTWATMDPAHASPFPSNSPGPQVEGVPR